MIANHNNKLDGTGMLILGRRPTESVVVGNDVKITILGIDRSGRVTFGIEAPLEVTVLREELYYEIERMKKVKQARSLFSVP